MPRNEFKARDREGPEEEESLDQEAESVDEVPVESAFTMPTPADFRRVPGAATTRAHMRNYSTEDETLFE